MSKRVNNARRGDFQSRSSAHNTGHLKQKKWSKRNLEKAEHQERLLREGKIDDEGKILAKIFHKVKESAGKSFRVLRTAGRGR